MSTVQTLIMAAAVWKVVRWKVQPRRARAASRHHDGRGPWLVAAVNDALIFGGLAYREHRRKARAGKPTAVADRRKSTWVKSTPLGGTDDGAVSPSRPPRLPFDQDTDDHDGIPF